MASISVAENLLLLSYLIFVFEDIERKLSKHQNLYSVQLVPSYKSWWCVCSCVMVGVCM